MLKNSISGILWLGDNVQLFIHKNIYAKSCSESLIWTLPGKPMILIEGALDNIYVVSEGSPVEIKSSFESTLNVSNDVEMKLVLKTSSQETEISKLFNVYNYELEYGEN